MPEGNRGDGRVVDRVGAIRQAVTAVASILVVVGVKVEFSKYRSFANLMCCVVLSKIKTWRSGGILAWHCCICCNTAKGRVDMVLSELQA